MEEEVKHQRYRLEWLVAAVFLVMALRVLSKTAADFDLWGYLAFGRLFWESGRFPYHDIFTYVPTLPRWVYHEWLTGVIYYPLYQALGGAGLQLLKFATALATAGLLFLTARRRGAEVLAILLTFIVIVLVYALSYSPVRAQVFTYLFFSFTLYALETARLTGRFRLLWLLAPLQVLWCNLHGGFLAGLGLIFIYALGEGLSRRPFWPYLAVFLLAGLATLINPYGLEYWTYIIRAVTMPRPEITEWQSLFTSLKTHVIGATEIVYLLLVAVIFIGLALWDRWRELTPILVSGLILFLGIRHIRHEAFFFLVVGAYAPLLLTAYLEKIRQDKIISRVFGAVGWKIPTCLSLIFMVALGLQTVRLSPLSLTIPAKRKPPLEIYYPVGALRYLQQERLAGNLVSVFHWGEYLIWNLYPACKVALDGRYETVYPDAVCREYFDFIFARPSWRTFLEKYDTQMILVIYPSEIYTILQGEKEWRQVYQDGGSALFLKNAAFGSTAPQGKP